MGHRVAVKSAGKCPGRSRQSHYTNHCGNISLKNNLYLLYREGIENVCFYSPAVILEGAIIDIGYHKTSFASWKEWMELCSIDLCSSAVSAELCGFAGCCFYNAWMRCTDGRSPDGAVENDRDAWHLLEIRSALPGKQSGKLYKHWLSERAAGAGDTLSLLESGAAFLLRDAVRDLWRNEASSPALSLNTPFPCCDDLTLLEILAGDDPPDEKVTQMECDQLAKRFAEEHYSDSGIRERAGVLAQSLGQSVAQSWVTDMAGCGSSSVYMAVNSGRTFLISRIERELRGEVKSVVRIVCAGALRYFSEMVKIRMKRA